ncbi:hypothetical protein GCK32_018862 [Trichostrongylus colubriformis]|uniref:RabBD domain-containing protein n=1 Tax=Trichostrongylus colubriformis TaxID=6319 RepID=A0AAN8FYS2_TRICO
MSKRCRSLPPSVMSMEETEQLYETLKGLSPREQAIIRPVLERDLEFQRREKARLRQLKTYVEMSEMQPPAVRKRPSSGYPIMQSMSTDSMISVASFRSTRPTVARSANNPPTGRVCFHCHCRLGLIFNAGTRCAQCGRLLCSGCRRGTHRSKWLCQTCFTQRYALII